MKSPVIVALDYPSEQSALELARKLDPKSCRVKVGKELFTAAGPAIVESLQKLGFDVFLDLKFHDIPQTVAKACQQAAGLGVWMVNVHASGGRAMLAGARQAIDEAGATKPILIGVTVLTSLSDQALNDVGVDATAKDQVLRLAGLCYQEGLDGVVCSAQEVPLIRDHIKGEFKLVTPGIRPMWANKNDQHRVVTPRQAVKDGSDYLVIGRPITASKDPLIALNKINQELG